MTPVPGARGAAGDTEVASVRLWPAPGRGIPATRPHARSPYTHGFARPVGTQRP
jgi:hypothetical protein